MALDIGNIIGSVREAAARVVEQVRQPPPPMGPEQIAARANAATADPQQRELLVAGYTRAQEQGDGALWRQTDGLATLYRDREVLALSRAIAPGDTVPDGWTRATPAQLAQYGIRDADLRPTGDDSGFRAELFIPDPEVYGADARPVLQFEGTNFGDLADVNADVAQAMGNEEAFYNQALDIATRVNQASGGNVIFSGHSLGGGLATAAGLVTGADTIVSNPAGVHPDTVAEALADRGLAFEDADGNVTTYAVDGDVLTELQDATAGLNTQNADSLAAILNGLGHGLNAWQDDVRFPTDVTGTQVRELPDAVGDVVTLDARNEDGSGRERVIALDDIVEDINGRVESMPLSDFGELVDGGTNWVDGATGLVRDVANTAGDGLGWLSDRLPDGGLLGGLGDVVSGGGDAVGTVGDWVEAGGDFTRDALEGVETVASVAVSAADGEVRDSMLEMVERHSFGVFDDSLGAEIGDREQALRDRIG
ncbi:hypothetical protein H0E84_06070 [Luteimonas sp. SJ-92]|uniref:Phospholipase n=1 Tax=Luteimonas salinisoli TaxID=2752307 RepID=A0A853JAS7_9GAMM|nr:hypothetical protein [Luteimonas salinisoli]NZA25945.1 hypothetical protein [Luteimonas salinisoli]